MPHTLFGKSAASVSGVAIVSIAERQERLFQVTIHDVTTGTGTVTLTVIPAGTDEYQAVEEGTVLLSDATAPKTFTIEGGVDAVKATSSSSSDVFTLLVGL